MSQFLTMLLGISLDRHAQSAAGYLCHTDVKRGPKTIGGPRDHAPTQRNLFGECLQLTWPSTCITADVLQDFQTVQEPLSPLRAFQSITSVIRVSSILCYRAQSSDLCVMYLSCIISVLCIWGIGVSYNKQSVLSVRWIGNVSAYTSAWCSSLSEI